MRDLIQVSTRLFALSLSLCFGFLLTQSAQAQIEHPDVLNAIRQLSSKETDERVAAANTLQEYGVSALRAAPKLIELLPDRSLTSEGEAASRFYALALGEMGQEVVPQLIALLDSENIYVIAGATEALHSLGPEAKEAVGPIVERLPNSTGDRRWGLIYAITGIGPDAAPAVEHLVPLLSNEDFQLQIIVCKALAAIGPASKPAVPTLVPMLETGVGSVKSHVALALGSIGPVEEYDIPALIGKLVEHPQFAIKERSLEALGMLGPEAKSQLEILDRLFDDPNYNAKIPLAVARWKVSGEAERSLTLLKELADNYEFELDAVHAVREFGPEAKDCVDWLLPKLTAVDTDVAYEAAFALAAIGDTSDRVFEGLAKLEMSDDEFAAEGAREAGAILRRLKTAEQ